RHSAEIQAQHGFHFDHDVQHSDRKGVTRGVFAANRITIVPLIRLSQIETQHWFQSSRPSCRYMQLRHCMHTASACITAETLRARFHRSEPRRDIHFRWKKSLMPVREGKWVTRGIRRVAALLWAPALFWTKYQCSRAVR